ncbi:hypothetical protein MNBD_IGNAVI01-309 [hydrothermal vent metagenome]|uniref:Uncharacterized protein n=1 Tax=hydrothermal vent metagenome TaxID=652676 RepID=A0A3B1CT81_9ZZZZ
MSPFQAPNTEAKYRLGNESETSLETAFVYFMKDKSGASFDTRILFVIVTPMSQTNIYQTTFSLREACVIARSIWKAFPKPDFGRGSDIMTDTIFI